MNSYIEKSKEKSNHKPIDGTIQQAPTFQLTDNRHEAIVYQKMKNIVDNNVSTNQFKRIHKLANNSIPTQATIQRRVPTASELSLTDSGETAPLFDARLDEGKLFTKTISTTTNISSFIIKKYIEEIRPVGAIAAGFPQYMDRAMVNPAAALGPVAPWPPALGGAFDVNLGAQMGLNATGVAFVRGKTKQEAINWLTAACSQPEMNLKNSKFHWVDPFLVEFTFNSTMRGHRPWVITTQFADSGTGYLVKIKNGEKDITGTIKTAADIGNLGNDPATSKTDFIYSSTHDQSDALFSNKIRDIGQHEEGSTRSEKEHGFDAITWLAAEGARFEPVRKMDADAKPTTEFYSKPGPGWTNARSATLSWLMQNWGPRFGKQYNITAATIAGIMGLVPLPLPPGLTAITRAPQGPRYNLATDKKE